MNKIEDFVQEDGSVLIPRKFIPFIKIEIPEKRKCLNCGLEFYPIHGKQKFCPPKPNKDRSNCGNTFNQRMKRKREKEKEKMN